MSTRQKNSALAQVISYTPPQLYTGKEWYVGFSAYDPATKENRRKKIKINHVKGVKERRKYAADLIVRVHEKLRRGWNPWIASEDSNSRYLSLNNCRTKKVQNVFGFCKLFI